MLRRTLLLAGALLFLGASPAGAQTNIGEGIESYDIAVVIRPDGTMAVKETIAYDFGANQRHGIFRHVPVRYRYDDRFDRVYKMSDIDVEGSPGTPTDTKVSDENGRKIIRIGDEDREITGKHTYTITYVVDGALNPFGDHDELYWNVIGDDWDVPIQQATATVATPEPISRVACFAGPTGVNIPCQSAVADGSTATFSHGPLFPHQGMTVVAAVPKGVVSRTGPILDERWTPQRAFSVNEQTVGLAGLVGLVGMGLVGRMLWTQGRDQRDAMTPPGDGPVEFRPPDDLRPAQVGVLIDERADPLDVTATIVDLAVRGYLTIEELPRSGLFKTKRDWRLRKTESPDDDLLVYERALRQALFADGEEVELSDLKNTFADDLNRVQDHLYVDSVRQGWFATRPDKVRTRWVLLGAAALTVGVAITVLLAIFTTYGIVGLPLVLVGLVLLFLHGRMPARTVKGSSTTARVRGFRRFIATAKAEEMQFAEDQQRFVDYLPYAIVFGSTKHWAKVFADLGASGAALSSPGWYSSPVGFNAHHFGDSVESFAVSTSGTIVSTPSSSGSSGFSGGSSGGGGGGGGGGSW